MRKAKIERSTAETSIELDLTIDGTGNATIRSGVGFLDHMLLLLTKHGLFDLAVTCNGDLEVDQHHSVEDIGIALGQAFQQALGNKEGITRYATVTTPMDEALSTISLDISGRPYFVYNVEGLKDKVGDFDTELVEEFFQAFVSNAKVTLHINLAYGNNTHHMIESIFKGFGRALDQATILNPRVKGIPSTKGSL
ncbi:imidazoleglycerol-phosphate dehydratase HisB [Oceanobacillus profundus]|uniref:Imidazoleglycerol-phosphate dehydratase n=1 Tax=Oceanobacillus profundus TaxID=372463 RepID=A0A417YEI3_9BACI|nr:imidazoleglycerol-phosphate dehydratase HisB [Oceanobacillus profundus]MBR3118463.1 imidazoleglycerol-phosphate dehydratase HisB [Oceanobacillus sp.]PAE28492.1 imidazoleglycerol-phosphate dehydratase [Paenibacillus sp. 7884-2]MCM3398988.1 imidazoleglycerol-phosphate dehydratase HisB [Oceanobacillus profundus]MDO6450650.1 imidazoleglycerol-phosphate dehydratase HisB [Oceanobacillus profundus]RHW31039.1 imidazoleglycerol-phosphate dehydratase HisB [Oceanobacillus profundus]